MEFECRYFWVETRIIMYTCEYKSGEPLQTNPVYGQTLQVNSFEERIPIKIRINGIVQ